MPIRLRAHPGQRYTVRYEPWSRQRPWKIHAAVMHPGYSGAGEVLACYASEGNAQVRCDALNLEAKRKERVALGLETDLRDRVG